jgi:hypothetical protein
VLSGRLHWPLSPPPGQPTLPRAEIFLPKKTANECRLKIAETNLPGKAVAASNAQKSKT